MSMQLSEKIINSLGVPQIEYVADKLPVNRNYTWGDLAGWRPLEDLTTPALHHDYYGKAKREYATPLQMMTEIANDHIKSTKNEKKGDAGFPYHFYIMRGRIYQANDIAARTYGVGSNNAYTVHICVHGNYFDADTLSDADFRCFVAVCLMLKETLPNFASIKGHGELNPSNCPGFNPQLVRDAVADYSNRMELAQKMQEDPKLIGEKIYSAANQHNYWYESYRKDPVANKWMEATLLELYKRMEELNMWFK